MNVCSVKMVDINKIKKYYLVLSGEKVLPIFDGVHLVFGVLYPRLPLLHDALNLADRRIKLFKVFTHLVLKANTNYASYRDKMCVYE